MAMAAELAALPVHSSVAVVTMRGSLCPITLGHVQCFEEARKLLLGLGGALPAGMEPFAYAVGFLSLNADHHLRAKFAGKREKPLGLADREMLVRIATAELAWLELSTSKRTAGDVAQLQQQFPQLSFHRFEMNGADDVVKYSKWLWAGPNHKMITMGRPGSTQKVVRGMARVGIPATGSADFLLGPELPDLSSTKLRAASRRGDRAKLLSLCHPGVAEWMLARDGHVVAAGIPTEPEPEPEPEHGAADASAGAPLLMAIVRRTDGGGVTQLRKVATTSRSGDVWTSPIVQVWDGEEVEVLRQEPASGFAWVRTSTGAEGYLNTAYFVGRVQAFVGMGNTKHNSHRYKIHLSAGNNGV